MSALLSGKFVTVTPLDHRGRKGARVQFENPDSPVQVVTPEGLQAFHDALDVVEAQQGLEFLILRGRAGKVHAGADLALFAGDIDPEAVHRYLMAGTRLDLRLKTLSRRMRTVSLIEGERFGGSVEWPLMAETSVCSPEAGIRFSEVHVGLIPGWDGILNAVLRCGWDNALVLAATGLRLDAPTLQATGMVTRVAPADHLLTAALEAAVADPPERPVPGPGLMSPEERDRIIAERTERARYEALLAELRSKLEAGEWSEHKDPPAGAGKYLNRRLEALGRPLAPRAVAAVFELFRQFPRVERQDEDGLKKMAHREAERCFELMHTQDRIAGVASVLSKDPLGKVPLFQGR